MLLSIIVPVYNVEAYLRRCLDSLLDQGGFMDYEVLLIDDGSTDQSGEICEEYAAASNRIHVFHKQNGGLSSARNSGIKSASGDYILFVDSDDYLRSNCLSGLMETALQNRADIVCFNYARVTEPYGLEINPVHTDIAGRVMSGEEYLLLNLRNGSMQMMACMNLYRRKLLGGPGLYFREGYVHEDEEWTPRVFVAAKRVCQYWVPIYGYYMRPDSISNATKDKHAAGDLIENCKTLKEFCSGIHNEALKRELENNTVMLALSAFYKGRLVEQATEIGQLINSLQATGKNDYKRKLFSISPSIYLRVNSTSKQLTSSIQAARMVPQFVHKCVDYGEQKTRKICREMLICSKQRKRLRNHDFSIISSSCNGGVITSELGEQFRTPTVNLWFTPEDFLKLCSNFEYFMGQDVVEVANRFQPYPVGKIDDVTVFFMHYHSFEEAREKWNLRKARINYDNLFFMMVEKDGCTPEMVAQFDALPYRHKVIFTQHSYPQFRSAIQVMDRPGEKDVGVLTDFVGLAGRRYDACFDYVSWLNGEMD